MKSIIVLLALGFSAVVCSAQEVQELKEARVEAASAPSYFLKGNNSSLVFKIPESYSGEFEENPLRFMNRYFDIQPVIAQLGDKDEYQVVFKSKKGQLKADFDRTGNLTYYSLKFKDVIVPYPLMVQLYKDHKGWALERNVLQAKGKGEKPGRAIYKVRMRNGSKKKDFIYYSNLTPQFEVDGTFLLANLD